MFLTSLNACKIKVKKLMTTKEQNNKYKSTKVWERPKAKKICALTSSVEPIDKDNNTQSLYSNHT